MTHARTPFGWQHGDRGHLVPRQSEQEVIVLVIELRDMSASTIAGRLTELGYRNRSGKPYSRNQIARVRTRALAEEAARRSARRVVGLED